LNERFSATLKARGGSWVMNKSIGIAFTEPAVLLKNFFPDLSSASALANYFLQDDKGRPKNCSASSSFRDPGNVGDNEAKCPFGAIRRPEVEAPTQEHP
jgi:hypothetical protein